MFKIRLLVVLANVLILAACSSTAPSGTTSSAQSSRYSISQDRAPSQALDPSLIREVIPEPLTRTTAGNRSPYTVNGRTYRVMASEEGFQQTGLASWYGEKFHGHLTSNGEIFDMYQVSAAHTSLPIPSFARVTNLENQRSIIVRVNDRGPFHNDRVIDLSYAAAWQLGFANQGTALVHIESIVPDQRLLASNDSSSAVNGVMASAGRYLQAGAFADLRAAERLSARLRELTTRPVFIRSVNAGNTRQQMHRVRVGPIADQNEIRRITEMMSAANLGQPFMVDE
ncbi:septal ring lytic transglycosylase RlpA family protein [Pseudohongiella spirulinae]|uniref:Endolytic peptidoglycan transglycosylase RlpA n=1 Tax=Pseudohongiella spirulinae TaxID=1249552 RepID=A0A0S2KEZ6_9GAMM|nr:septal ring lytic transglycosylase RlpA family protein [Pseudohongiella spirulinae]ALO46809.1 rare lipoprotein A [Pseudohongiella spirulinae]